MRQSYYILMFATLVLNIHGAPQFITFADGKLGVNFGGYHAGVGIGGGGGKGGLFAQAGTPLGQSAIAGLGGSVDDRFGSEGGLFAGATAGGNVKASAGLAGHAGEDKTSGSGFAKAQAGDRFAAAGMEGESGIHGKSEISFSSHKTFVPKIVEKEVNVEVQPLQPVKTKVYHKVHTKLIEDVNPLPLAVEKTKEVNEVSRPWRPFGNFERSPSIFQGFLSSMFRIPSREHFGFPWTRPQETVENEVYVPAPPVTKVIEKTRVHVHGHKPHRHHLRKTAYIGGYLGGEAAPAPPPVYVKSYQPIEKRVDVDVGGSVGGDVHSAGASQVGYRKEVSIQRNPTFFADIFNIPISTLKAVGNFLGNTAGSTNVSVQKSATFEKDSISPKHSGVSSSSSNTHVSLEAPPASKFIDDIFAIPINTLGAVNKFLENNVPARKRVQVTEDGAVEQEKVRLGPHARRRANKQIIVYQNTDSHNDENH